MKDTRYTITSRKVVALALVLVLLATMFVGCNSSKDEENSKTTTTTEVQTTIEVVTEIVTDENGETVTDDNGEVLTTEVTKVVEVSSQSDEDNEEPSSDKSNSTSTTSTTKSSTTTTTKQTETTTRKNSSSGSSNKVTTTSKPVTTTKPVVTTTEASCKHNYELISYTNGCYVYYCSKCDYYKSEEREMNPNDFMGSKSEYYEFLDYVNQARREAGLHEVQYLDIAQKGADTRAQEITQKFSHTRPNGKRGISAVGECIVEANIDNLAACNENIHSGFTTAKGAFNSWMNSEGHRANIMSEGISYVVVARCDNYWVMIGIAIVDI